MSQSLCAEVRKMALIEKGDIIRELRRIPGYLDEEREILIPLRDVCGIINQIQEVDAAPVVHGHWINHFDDLFPEDSTIECSECHEHTHYMPDDNYCPNCGAKMDGGS